MYISRLTIQNFRNFKDLDISFEEQTIIVGANRAGKSNLLTAIQLAIDPEFPPNSRKSLLSEDFFRNRVVAEGVKISVEITSKDDDDWIADFDAAAITTNPKTARFTYWFCLKPQPPIVMDDDNSQGNDTAQSLSISSFHNLWYVGTDDKANDSYFQMNWKYLQLISIHMLHALRDANDLLVSRSRSTVNISEILKELDLDPTILGEVKDEIQTAGNRLAEQTEVKNLTDNIRNHTAEMVGVFEIAAKLNVVTGDEQQLMRAFRIFVDDREMARSSLGEANILYFALLIEYIKKEQNKAKDNFVSIICLEEPEAHVHPHVQRAIFRYFIDKVSSLIVTTHSPHLASVSPLKSLVVLQNSIIDGTKASSIKSLLSDGHLSEEEIIDIERYLDVTRSELVFSRGVILVEGIAEAFIIPAFFKILFGVEPDKLGISIVSVNGTNFAPFAKILSRHGFNIPFIIFSDGDRLAQYDDDGNLRSKQSGILGLERKKHLEEMLITILDSNPQNKVFIGDYTLEVDLILSGYIEEFAKTSSSLFTQQARMYGIMDRLVRLIHNDADVKAMKEMLERVEDKGKGRFAQKLAVCLDQRCPDYIRQGLEVIYMLAEKSNLNDITS